MQFKNSKSKETFNNLLNNYKSKLVNLDDKPEETPEAVISALWSLTTGKKLSAEATSNERLNDLSDDDYNKLQSFLKERIEGRPLAHITERQQFMNIEMLAGPEALIPRKETELVCQLGLNSIDQILLTKNSAKVIDVCTGAGNLACALAYNYKEVEAFASDLSEQAIDLANKNASFVNVKNQIKFYVGDLLSPFATEEFFGKIDVLVCNPPYISTKKLESMESEIISFEPQMAFNGGAFGISILSKLIKEAPKYIVSGGFLCFEVGLGQGPGILKMIERTGNFQFIESLSDKDNNIRAIRVKKKG